jgi:hypothetical protein
LIISPCFSSFLPLQAKRKPIVSVPITNFFMPLL